MAPHKVQVDISVWKKWENSRRYSFGIDVLPARNLNPGSPEHESVLTTLVLYIFVPLHIRFWTVLLEVNYSVLFYDWHSVSWGWNYSTSRKLLNTGKTKISYWKIRDLILATAEQVDIILLVPCILSTVIHVHQKYFISSSYAYWRLMFYTNCVAF